MSRHIKPESYQGAYKMIVNTKYGIEEYNVINDKNTYRLLNISPSKIYVRDLFQNLHRWVYYDQIVEYY